MEVSLCDIIYRRQLRLPELQEFGAAQAAGDGHIPHSPSISIQLIFQVTSMQQLWRALLCMWEKLRRKSNLYETLPEAVANFSFKIDPIWDKRKGVGLCQVILTLNLCLFIPFTGLWLSFTLNLCRTFLAPVVTEGSGLVSPTAQEQKNRKRRAAAGIGSMGSFPEGCSSWTKGVLLRAINTSI